MLSGLIFHLHCYNERLVIFEKQEACNVRRGGGGSAVFYISSPEVQRAPPAPHICHRIWNFPCHLRPLVLENTPQQRQKQLLAEHGILSGRRRRLHTVFFFVSWWTGDVWVLNTFPPYAWSDYINTHAAQGYAAKSRSVIEKLQWNKSRVLRLLKQRFANLKGLALIYQWEKRSCRFLDKLILSCKLEINST